MHQTRILQIQQAALLAGKLQDAILQSDADVALDLANQIVGPALDNLERDALPEELEIRRTIHEIIDDALRGLLLAEGTETEHWKRLVLPNALGLFEFPNLMTHADLLDLCGSGILDRNPEALDPKRLAGMSFKSQALQLGRFCVSNDGRTPIDYRALVKVLDARVLPAFNNWLLTVHVMSPTPVARPDVERNQSASLAQFLSHPAPATPLPATPRQATTAFTSPYWSDTSQRSITEVIHGRQMRGYLERFLPEPQAKRTATEEFDSLRGVESIVVCPNWFDEHVIHRCMSPLTNGMRDSGSRAVRIYRELLRGHTLPATDWEDVTTDIFHSEQDSLTDVALICRELRGLEIDFAFHPEIVPVNPSSWMASERLARVQATGYGFPVTSGLRNMDYFVGGRDVEPEASTGSDYTERLVLLPGLGVSTTPPPIPETSRVRPVDDEQIRICATASKNKLGTELLTAWNAVQKGESNTSLTFFSNMSTSEASHRSGAIGELLTDGEVDLTCGIPRRDLVTSMADADLYLDSYPFGGFNSLVEALVHGVPVVTLEGQQARSRFGAAILRKLGLPDFLIAHNYQGYVAAAKRLIRDAGLRQSIRDQLGTPQQVLMGLADPDMSAHFDAAVTWMREQGPRGRKDLPPVYIEAGQAPRILSA
jgi:hypothetical protein